MTFSSATTKANPRPARISKLYGSAIVFCFIGAAISPAVAAATVQTNRHSYPNLTTEHWQDMNYDQYLRTYPQGNVMSLNQYVDQLSLPEKFECGVGKLHSCQISQFGQSIDGTDWYILFATTVWNFYSNSLVHALNKSATLAKAVVHETLTDLIVDYNPQNSVGLLTEVDLLNILFISIDSGGNQDPLISEQTHEPDWMAAIKPIATTSPQNPGVSLKKTTQDLKYARMKRHLSGPSPIPQVGMPLIAFNSTQTVETNLVQLSQQLHGILVQSIENKINSPISLETGIYSALQFGRFASPNLEPAQLIKPPAARLLTVSSLLNHQNAMIVVRKANCSQSRKSIENQKSRLAFCSSDNTLIQFVVVTGEDSFTDKIYNAHLIHEKYGFKAAFLASEASRCHQSLQNRRDGIDSQDDDSNNPYEPCTFQLPICNLTAKDYQLSPNFDNLVRICRQEVGLPI